MATIAVFVSLGGGAYAALRITGREVVNSSLRGADVRNGSLTGRDIRDRSITTRDLARNVLRPGSTGPAGPASAQGPHGPQGPRGPQGASAATHWIVAGMSAIVWEGSPGATVERQSPGVYFVRWGVDIGRCAAVATPGRAAKEGTHGGVPRAYAVVANYEGSIQVETFDHEGQPTDASFNLVATC